MGCRVCPVGDLIEYSTGGGWGKQDSQGDNNTRVAIIRGADFPSVANGNSINLPIRWEKKTKAERASLQAGDIVLEISGGTDSRPTGRTVYITAELLGKFDCPVIPASFCRLVRPIEGINSAYLYFWLQDMFAKGRTWSYQNRSTGLSNLQYKVFTELEMVRLPSLASQQRIASALATLEKKRRLNNRINDYLAA